MTRLPQVMINVRDVDKTRAGIDTEITAAVAHWNRELGGNGRVVLRPSGTEPVVRVMVEAGSIELAERISGTLAEVVKRRLQF